MCRFVLEDEELCCHEIALIEPHIEGVCATGNELFHLLCLHRRQLEVWSRQLRFYNPMYLPDNEDHNRYIDFECTSKGGSLQNI